MAFYTLRALSTVGGQTYDTCFYEFWEPWRRQLAINMTTWVEDLLGQRSDCHAWASLPLYEFTAEVAGFKHIMESGNRMITFKPRVHPFKKFSAEVPGSGVTGKAIIARVSWEVGADNVVGIHLS
ncbi:hypothetical protein BJY00DRAFT_314239 [Aspergillus carlsbadensis]|nr:hypothetical protein BJY00DRAFT_314239 [Aspergillus carlsbadensis]